MSYPQDGRSMDRARTPGGSVKRARERAQAGLPREVSGMDEATDRQLMDERSQGSQGSRSLTGRQAGMPSAGSSRPGRPQAPASFQNKDGQIGVAISRPTQMPQWPLAGSLGSPPYMNESEPYRPPPGRTEPPQRPPRPSMVPSILDGSRVQDHTPVFQYTPQSPSEPGVSPAPPHTPSSVSRPSTLSSVGEIPDFPLPVQAPPPIPAAPRRSVNLGPPPSSRRGASSFYSNASYVSPIPEESLGTKTHTSFASSAAMPESWRTPSPGQSPANADGFFDDTIAEEGSATSPYDDGDESQLVRSASIGKRGRANLVTTTSGTASTSPPPENGRRPGPSPVQGGAFQDGTGYLDGSLSSSDLPTITTRNDPESTANAILDAYGAASSTDPSNPDSHLAPGAAYELQTAPDGRPYSRLSAIRRPPRLDIDAVKKAEARGSLTSLPDLIRRATRLAASLENGRRPASRFDDLDAFAARNLDGWDGEKEFSVDAAHQSGLSDMLAAFPPPAHANNSRQSFRQSLRDQVSSWPLPLNYNAGDRRRDDKEAGPGSQPRRKCCGLPSWAVVFIVIIILIIIAAAVVIPLELLVLHKKSTTVSPATALARCEAQIKCLNGATNVVSSEGFCSCVCVNGFTGVNCNMSPTAGCTTVDLAPSAAETTNLNNVTLGDALPRLIEQAQTNFSVPLSSSLILTTFSSSNLSCSAENALVTFDGDNFPQGAASAAVTAKASAVATAANEAVALAALAGTGGGVAYTTVTVMAGLSSTATLVLDTSQPPQVGGAISTTTQAMPSPSSTYGSGYDATTTITITVTKTVSSSISSPAAPTATFAVTEEIVDFARVAILFILQQESLVYAEVAQDALQQFFTTASQGSSGVSNDSASNVTLGYGNSIDLVGLNVDAAGDLVGLNAAPSRSRRR